MNNSSWSMFTRRINTTFIEDSFELTGGVCWLTSATATYAYASLLVLLAVMATIENLIVIIVICKHVTLRRPSVLLLGILATIDFLTGCIVTPIKASITLEHDDSWFHTFWWMFTAVVFLELSIVMLISFDRLFHVYFLEKYNLTKKKLCLVLFLNWVAPFILIILVAFQIRVGVGGAAFALTYFFFCILAMLLSYIAMIINLRKHTANVNNAIRQDYMEKQWRAVNTTLIIIITFTAMNIPPILSITLGFMGIFSRTLCAITFFAMLANSAVNPLIYSSRIPSMKRHIFRLLHIGKVVRRGENPEEESPDEYLSEGEGNTEGNPEGIPPEGSPEGNPEVTEEGSVAVITNTDI